MINKQSHVPVYAQIEEQLKQQIVEQKYPVGAMIPSERELSTQYGVSRMTVRQALAELVAEGLLRREKGKGTFVANPKLEQPLNGLTSFTEDMRSRGLEPSSQIVVFEKKKAPFDVQKDLMLEANDIVYYIIRIRNADGEPMAVERTYLPVSLFPQLQMKDIQHSLYRFIEGEYNYQIGNAIQQMEAALITKEDATFLNVRPDAVALLIKRTSYLKDGRPFESVHSAYRADRYKFISEIKR